MPVIIYCFATPLLRTGVALLMLAATLRCRYADIVYFHTSTYTHYAMLMLMLRRRLRLFSPLLPLMSHRHDA